MKSKFTARLLGALLACAMLCSLLPTALADSWDSKVVKLDSSFDLRVPCTCTDPNTNSWDFECDYGVYHRNNSGSSRTAAFYAYESGYTEIRFMCDECFEIGFYSIYVEAPVTPIPEPLGLYLDSTHESLNVDSTMKLNAYWNDPTVVPNLVWTSSNERILTVSGSRGSATVYGVSDGTASVTVRDTISGESDTCYFLVNAGKVNIQLSQPSPAVYSLGARATELLCAAVATDAAGNYIPSSGLSYQWYSGPTAATCNTPISRATTASYTPSTDQIGTTYYACAVDYSVGSLYERAVTSPVPVTVQGEAYNIYINTNSSRLDYKGSTAVTATVYRTNSYGSPVVDYSSYPVNWSIDSGSYASLDTISNYTSNGVASNVLRYYSAASSNRNVNLTASVYIDGRTYTATKTITLNKYSSDSDRDRYSVVVSADSNSIKYGETVNVTAKLYDGSSLITRSDPTVTWSLRNANGNVQLAQYTTYSSRGMSTNALVNCAALNSSCTVQVQASITIGNQTYVGYKDITIKASTSPAPNPNGNSSITQAITSCGVPFSNTNIINIINNKNVGASYVKFNTPAVNVGRLLYGYNGVNTKLSRITDNDKVYLGNGNMTMNSVYFLPAADCASQVQVSYTVYNASGVKLSTGTCTFNVNKATVSSNFNDVTAAWCADAIDFMADNGIVNGTGYRQFSPSNTMTRAMLLTILYRAAGSPSIAGLANTFGDINPNDYFYAPVLWAYSNGYATATGYNTFGANDLISREEIMSILWKYSGSPSATGNLNSFSDRNNVSSYAKTALIWAVNKGYIKGNAGQILPQGNATRAEVSVILHRFFTE